MHGTEDDGDDGRVMNVLQIVALSVITTTGAVIAFGAAGAPFGASLMAGFATGPFLTMAIALTVAWVKDKSSRSRKVAVPAHFKRSTAKGPPVVQGQFSTIEALWNSDKMLEMEYARAQGTNRAGLPSPRATPAECVAMWELDAERDNAAQQRAMGAEDDVQHRPKRRVARR